MFAVSWKALSSKLITRNNRSVVSTPHQTLRRAPLGRSPNAIRAVLNRGFTWYGGKRNGCGAAVFEPEKSSAVFTGAGGGLQREKRLHATKLRAGQLKEVTQELKGREASLHSAKRVKVEGGREAG